ncbi:VPS9 domain-containing protein [Trichophyton equinum CBS 127.97]|uniref:VPS9 domain-containing protein n=1 Tax=Trichophyton equinum (strain ATCC MYA-4606 / CBS 127.97) TaxID=559882 RepID=F2PWY7_TRIEC|nr:VPS9 domain-containing protein [Trichophyton equinum CBS 127.97]
MLSFTTATLSQATRSKAAASSSSRRRKKSYPECPALSRTHNEQPSFLTTYTYTPTDETTGNIGFRKGHRGDYDAAHQLAVYVMGKIQERGFLMQINGLEVILRGFGPGREAFTKVLLGKEGKVLRERIVRVSDSTRLKFGGTRSPAHLIHVLPGLSFSYCQSTTILLVPLTESLINSRDRESGAQYADLVTSEDFLASHILRITGSPGSAATKEISSLRDQKGKAWQMATANGRTVVIKESVVYSNKGFKMVNHAQLLSDVLYSSPNDSSQQWAHLLHLKGSSRLLRTRSDCPGYSSGYFGQRLSAPWLGLDASSTFSNYIRMRYLVMKPGLDRLFREFGKELGKPLPPPPSESPVAPERPNDRSEVYSSQQNSTHSLPFGASEQYEDEEDIMRNALDTAVTAAIDIFRLVDKQQLSLLGATTDLTGPMVERLIERYVLEQVHDNLLFPRICECRQSDDLDLDLRVRQMENIDVSQVGIPVDGGHEGREDLRRRIATAVEEFRKISDAKCPQDMLAILLKTVKIVTIDQASAAPDNQNEKPSVLTINADMLVSLLLLVVIRSHVRHLYARLLYMQRFIFVDDVESGESGYALSTFEGVLIYLQNDSAGLRKASSRNKRLWSATKHGKIPEMAAILQPELRASSPVTDENDCENEQQDDSRGQENERQQPVSNGVSSNRHKLFFSESSCAIQDDVPETPRLAHVFPFQTWDQPTTIMEHPKPRKKVSMDTRSMSESSTTSFLSRSTTFGSIAGGIEGDTSVQSLTTTKDPSGHSVPMMAVESCQPEALSYLLGLSEYYPRESILQDTNSEGTTLLSAAVQLAHTEIINILIEYILQGNESEVALYLAKADNRGRTVAHYLFNSPALLSRLGKSLPWTLRDRNGQTPLFALCRSYDHPDYNPMVNEALTLATQAQGDGKPLRLDDHVDAKGNTLLHIVSDPQILLRILRQCDGDPNYTNDRRFTPLMVASKYGRIDLVRTLFADPRVDVHLRESRGLTAIELAKDDEIRNRIDDLVLCSSPLPSSPDASNRTTSVVRSLFVEDFGIRFIIKSGAPSPSPPSPDPKAPRTTTYTVTTCRRSLNDFENLLRFLRVEHPASYLPEMPHFRSPFQIPSKPSRAVLHDIQERLDRLLKVLLAHPTFSTHELLWEFFLVPEIQTEMIDQRSARKATVLAESIMDDYEPASAEVIRSTQQILSHAEDAVQSVNEGTRNLICCGYLLQNASTDFADALFLCSSMFSSLQPPANILPHQYVRAFHRFVSSFNLSSTDSSPLLQFLAAITSSQNTTRAMLTSLSRPNNLILTLNSAQRSLSRARSAVASSSLPRKFNFSVLEESRQRSIREQENKIATLTTEIEEVRKEISWNKEVVVGELAGWSSWREQTGRKAIRDFVKTTLIREKERGKRMERCLRMIKG